ncbi:MAG: hypothetical protein ACM3WV_00170 [Bacillota bacterium]
MNNKCPDCGTQVNQWQFYCSKCSADLASYAKKSAHNPEMK